MKKIPKPYNTMQINNFWKYVAKCAKKVRNNKHLANLVVSDPWTEGHRELNLEVLDV